jgi:hypothetical protein
MNAQQPTRYKIDNRSSLELHLLLGELIATQNIIEVHRIKDLKASTRFNPVSSFTARVLSISITSKRTVALTLERPGAGIRMAFRIGKVPIHVPIKLLKEKIDRATAATKDYLITFNQE